MSYNNRAARRAHAARRQERREDAIYAQNLRNQQRHFDRTISDEAAADAERDRTMERLRNIETRSHADATKAAEAVHARYDAEVRKLLTAPKTFYTGATTRTASPLWVSHWRSDCPPSVRRITNAPAGREHILMALLPGGPVRFAPSLLSEAFPELVSDAAFSEWRATAVALQSEAASRYKGLIEKLRYDAAFAQLAEAAGLTDSSTVTQQLQFGGEVYERKITRVYVPELTAVDITQEGLELTYAHHHGANAKSWSAKLDVLKNSFRAVGMNADHLRLADGHDGSVRMCFDDAPSAFPAAVCLAPPSRPVRNLADAVVRYAGAAWTLGVDARGNNIAFPLEDFPHALAVGGTGAGKSVWARSIIEMFRTGYCDPDSGKDTAGGFTCFVSSGKVTDFVTLHNLPGVAMVAGDAAQTAVMVRTVRVEAERRYQAAADAKLAGDTRAFSFPPILLLLDEWGATHIAMSSKYKTAKPFEDDVDLILRVGREARVHVVLLSQTIRKTGAGAVPGSWQANLGLTISLGKPEIETLQNPAVFPASVRDSAEAVGSRIAGKKGRGLIALEGRARVTEFQSYYVWSPGTTSLDPDADPRVRPPTPEVREMWEAWEPVSASGIWVMPRYGIKAGSPSWADGTDLSAVAETPVTPLITPDGEVIASRKRFDPWSPQFQGRAAVAQGRTLGFDDEPQDRPAAPAADTAPARVEPEPVRTTDLADLSEDELLDELNRRRQTRPASGEAEVPDEEPADPAAEPAAAATDSEGWNTW